MKRLAFLLLLSMPCLAATKVFMHDATSAIQLSPDYQIRRANSTQGSSVQTAVTNTIAATAPAPSGQYWPSTSASIIITKTAAGTKTIWLSDPLSAGVTISGTITPNLYCSESSSNANAALKYEVLKWTPAGGIGAVVGISVDDGMTECDATVRTTPTISPTSTAFATGDRIVIVIFNDNGNGVSETASSRTLTFSYDAGTGVAGDSYLSFTEAISFAASDSNNQLAKGTTE